MLQFHESSGLFCGHLLSNEEGGRVKGSYAANLKSYFGKQFICTVLAGRVKSRL